MYFIVRDDFNINKQIISINKVLSSRELFYLIVDLTKRGLLFEGK